MNKLWLLGITFLLTLVLVSMTVISWKGSDRSAELLSPSDWVKEGQIQVYPDHILLEVPGASWATFTDTNSMDPFLDEKANAMEVLPKDLNSIQAGDVISYESPTGMLIHRVQEKGRDELGPYFVVKGDNTTFADPQKVRFTEVQGVLVAIIY